MLAINRRTGQSFTIGNHIEIFIVFVRGVYVKLSIDAPKHLPILRDNTINREKKHKIAEEDRATPEVTTRAPQRG